jgi:hypothetical protein
MGLRRALRGCVATAKVSTVCRGPAAASCGLGWGHQSSAHTGAPAYSTLSTAKVASTGSAVVLSAWPCVAGASTGQLHSSTALEVNRSMQVLSVDRGNLMGTD